MTTAIAFLIAVGLALPLSAQTRSLASTNDDLPAISLRSFFVASGEQFRAKDTFTTVFGKPFQPLWGGGVQLVFRQGFYVEAGASQFKKDGQRVFRSATGETFSLGNSFTATLIPFEITGGYRFHFQEHERLIPYVGAGAGYYGYKETCIGDASRPALCQAIAADVDKHHIGLLVVGGAEVRVHRWVGIGIDAQFTRLTGIFGQGGVSSLPEVNESDLGGIAARVKVVIGR